MNVKISPSSTPVARRRCARGDLPDSLNIEFPRKLETFAGEIKKIWRVRDFRERFAHAKLVPNKLSLISLFTLFTFIAISPNNNHSVVRLPKNASKGRQSASGLVRIWK